MSGLVIACGGTGGHLAPGIALAEALRKQGCPCWLLISTKTVDARLAEKYADLDFIPIPGAAFSLNPWRLAVFISTLLKGYWVSVRLLIRHRPQAVVGFGGFLTMVVGLAALTGGYPLMLHEANRRPGRAVRLLARFSRRVYLPEGVELKTIDPERVRHCGYPVRCEVRRLPKALARQRLGVDLQAPLLVVLGGSQGAAFLNEWALKHAEELGRRGISMYVIYGPNKPPPHQNESSSNSHARIYWTPFSEDMAAVLSSADVIVARAGAGSLAEIIRCRVPAILVPYPYAADDHQVANAAFMAKYESARVVSQSDGDALFKEVLNLIGDQVSQSRLRDNLEGLDRTDGLERLIEDLDLQELTMKAMKRMKK